MKIQLVTALALLAILASCSGVRFMQPQPKDAHQLSSFPKKYQGVFVDEKGKDTLTIYSNAFLMTKELHSLADNDVVLKKLKKFRVLSKKTDKEEGAAWEVFLLECNRDTLMVYAISFDGKSEREHIYAQIEAELETKKVYSSNGNLEYLLIDPTKKQLKTLIDKDVFTVQLRYFRIK